MNGFLTEKATTATSSKPSLAEQRSKTPQALTSSHNASATFQFYRGQPVDSDDHLGDPGGDPYYSPRESFENSPISSRSTASLQAGQHMDLVNQSSFASSTGSGSLNNHTASLLREGAATAEADDNSAHFGGRFILQSGNQVQDSHKTELHSNITDYVSAAMDTTLGNDKQHTVFPDAMQSSGDGGGHAVGSIGTSVDYPASYTNGTYINNNQSTPFWDYVDLGNVSFVGPLPTGLFPDGDSNNYTFCNWNFTLCYNFSHTTENPLDSPNLTPESGGASSSGPPSYWALFLLIFPMLTLFGNVLVCLSVYKERPLRTITNYFIVSLAVADILVAVLVMPMAVYVEVSQTKIYIRYIECVFNKLKYQVLN